MDKRESERSEYPEVGPAEATVAGWSFCISVSLGIVPVFPCMTAGGGVWLFQKFPGIPWDGFALQVGFVPLLDDVATGMDDSAAEFIGACRKSVPAVFSDGFIDDKSLFRFGVFWKVSISCQLFVLFSLGKLLIWVPVVSSEDATLVGCALRSDCMPSPSNPWVLDVVSAGDNVGVGVSSIRRTSSTVIP